MKHTLLQSYILERDFINRAAEQEHMSKDNTYTDTHTHAVVRARFLKRKIHTHKKRTKQWRNKILTTD